MTPELLRERLAQAGDERMKVAEDLFGVADFLRTNSSVQRALTDPRENRVIKTLLLIVFSLRLYLLSRFSVCMTW